MKETISVAEARRRFAQLLRGVRDGRSYVVTVHGRPDRTRAAAHARLLARLRAQPAIEVARWTRDELYPDAT